MPRRGRCEEVKRLRSSPVSTSEGGGGMLFAEIAGVECACWGIKRPAVLPKVLVP